MHGIALVKGTLNRARCRLRCFGDTLRLVCALNQHDFCTISFKFDLSGLVEIIHHIRVAQFFEVSIRREDNPSAMRRRNDLPHLGQIAHHGHASKLIDESRLRE